MSSCANNKNKSLLDVIKFKIHIWETESKIKTHLIIIPSFLSMFMRLNIIKSNLHQQNFIIRG